MRVFLDTNVLVSAFATRGLCTDVVRLVLSEHTLVTSEVVPGELGRVLTGRMGVPPQRANEIDTFLREHEVVPRPNEPSAIQVRDEDDRWVLASAVAGEVDVLVTGDRDLLDVAVEAPLRIITPRGFWDLSRES